MQAQLTKIFLFSAGGVLLTTAAAKIASSFGNAGILKQVDPILGLQFGHLMFCVGVLELVIASICLLGKSRQLGLILVAWFTANLLVYRVGLWAIGWHRPCSCLGNLTDAIRISPRIADTAMKIILTYLLIGSYGILLGHWLNKRKLTGNRSELKSTNSQMGVGG